MKELLTQLRESQDFRVIMDELKKQRPVVVEYKPQKTMDETNNVMEQIKYNSAQRSGFDLLYQLLTGNKI